MKFFHENQLKNLLIDLFGGPPDPDKNSLWQIMEKKFVARLLFYKAI